MKKLRPILGIIAALVAIIALLNLDKIIGGNQ